MSLNLNWNLTTAEERTQYISTLDLSKLSKPELNLITTYILYGKDPDGKNLAQKHYIYLSKVNTSHPEASLDELFENPAFSESSLTPLRPPARAIKETFDRTQALTEAPPDLIPTFTALFSQIDAIESRLYYYKGKTPREGLPQSAQFQFEASQWTARDYARQKQLLIELRRQQYTLRDSYKVSVVKKPFTMAPPLEANEIEFGSEIGVLPLGLYKAELFQLEPDPYVLEEEDLKALSERLNNPVRAPYIFDFENEIHVRELFDVYLDIENEAFRKTFEFYRSRAGLTPVQNIILDEKMRGKTNEEINEELGEDAVAVNYISSIYRKRIPHLFSEAARRHREEVENIFFKENFKVCKRCGRTFLRNEEYFVKNRKNSDGLSGVCKECQKEKRKEKKEQK